jgi:hypothetical protein
MPKSNTQGSVSFSQGITLNMGNFESCKLEVGIVMPVSDDRDSDFMEAVAFVEKNLKIQINDVLSKSSESENKPKRRRNSR